MKDNQTAHGADWIGIMKKWIKKIWFRICCKLRIKGYVNYDKFEDFSGEFGIEEFTKEMKEL